MDSKQSVNLDPGRTSNQAWIPLIAVLLIVFSADTCWAQITLPPSAQKRITRLENRYGIAVEWQAIDFPIKTTHGSITGRNATRNEITRYVALLASEFNLYPRRLVRVSRLKRIVLCKRLAFANQPRNAIPELASDTLYLDCVRGRHSPEYQRTVIHHEYYHLIDYKDDGKLYEDTVWARLNPRSFRYAAGGASVQRDPNQSLFTNAPGFLTNYSRSGVEEDKAELFAHKIVNPNVVARRKARDEVVRSKVELLERQLKRFCPDMNESFWASIRRRHAIMARRNAQQSSSR